MPGTPPQGWQTPKTSYDAEDVLTPEQFERIEGNAYATELGARTIDPAQAPTGLVGTLRQFLDWFANRLKAITGETNWYDAPDVTLSEAKTHIDAAAPHSGHETPAGAQGKVDTHAALTSIHGATSEGVANRIMMRDSAGRAKVAAPSAADDIARKDTVDTAIDAAVTALEAIIGRHIYDQYDLHMELYYTGHHSGPSIAGLLGMTFDGFLDTLRVNTGATTAVVDTTEKAVKCPLSPAQYTFTGVTSPTTSPIAAWGALYGNQIVNLNYLIDGTTTNAATLAAPYGGGSRRVAVLDLGSVKPVDTLIVKMYKTIAAGGSAVLGAAYSDDGSIWTVPTTGSFYCTTSQATYEISLGGVVSARYIAVWLTSDAPEEASGPVLTMQEMTAEFATRVATSVLQSTTKTLDAAPTEVALYMSVKTPSDSSVVPQVSCDGGAHWESLTLDSSRADPQFAGYTEKKYVLAPVYPGNQIILKTTLTPSTDGASSPEIKRYGLYWG